MCTREIGHSLPEAGVRSRLLRRLRPAKMWWHRQGEILGQPLGPLGPMFVVPLGRLPTERQAPVTTLKGPEHPSTRIGALEYPSLQPQWLAMASDRHQCRALLPGLDEIRVQLDLAILPQEKQRAVLRVPVDRPGQKIRCPTALCVLPVSALQKDLAMLTGAELPVASLDTQAISRPSSLNSLCAV